MKTQFNVLITVLFETENGTDIDDSVYVDELAISRLVNISNGKTFEANILEYETLSVEEVEQEKL